MEQEEYALVIDDTGYDVIDKDKRSLKYHVGILLPEKQRETIKEKVFQIMTKVKAANPDEINEIHACEIQGLVATGKLKENIFIKYLTDIYKVIVNPQYDIKIFISSGFVNKSIPIENQLEITEKIIEKRIIVHKKDFNPSTELEHFLYSRNKIERNDMMSVYYLANSYLQHFKKGARITRVYCDEGMRKSGSEIHIKDETTLKFISSKESILVQLADTIAWNENRGSIVAVHKVNKGEQKPNGVDRCATYGVLKMSSQTISSSGFVMKGVPIEAKYRVVIDDVKAEQQTIKLEK